MATDPIPALLDLAKATPDPRALANWLEAYLGTRPLEAKVAALRKLELAFDGGMGGADPKVVAMILRIIRRAQENLAAAGGRPARGRK